MIWLFLPSAALACWPLSGTATPDPIQDPFGPRLIGGAYDYHRGLDLDGTTGDPVHVVADGKVVRTETAAASASTGRASYGNWVLVEHASRADGTPVHTAYLHLASFSARVGDLVSEGDTLGEVGSTGVATRTDHLHLVAFEGLVKTYVKKEKAVSPFRVIDTGVPTVATVDVTDAVTVEVTVDIPTLDAVRFEFVGTDGSHVIDFETAEGLCGDAATCEGATIAPGDITVASTQAVWTFSLPLLGVVTGVEVYDSGGDLVGSW